MSNVKSIQDAIDAIDFDWGIALGDLTKGEMRVIVNTCVAAMSLSDDEFKQIKYSEDEGEKTYIIEVEMSEGNIYKRISETTLNKIMQDDTGVDVVTELIFDGKDVSINSSDDVDLYYGYPDQWEDEVKQEWRDYLC